MPVTLTIYENPPGVTILGQEAPGIVVSSATAPGPAGADGADASEISHVAGAALGGLRLVVLADDGRLVYADNTDPSHLRRAVWITTAAVVEDDPVVVKTYGEITESGWAWTPGSSLYLGTNGQLTTTPPSVPAVFLVQVAHAVTPTTIFFNPRQPISLV